MRLPAVEFVFCHTAVVCQPRGLSHIRFINIAGDHSPALVDLAACPTPGSASELSMPHSSFVSDLLISVFFFVEP